MPSSSAGRNSEAEINSETAAAHPEEMKATAKCGITAEAKSLSVAIGDNPAVVANSLPVRVLRRMSPQVIGWVSRNKDALLDFGVAATPGHSRKSTTSFNSCSRFDDRFRLAKTLILHDVVNIPACRPRC
jgi:hypothetical protein